MTCSIALAWDSAHEGRRARCVAMLATDSGLNNALLADRLDAARVVLGYAIRTGDGAVLYGEAVVPLGSWNPGVFSAYAKAMRDDRPH